MNWLRQDITSNMQKRRYHTRPAEATDRNQEDQIGESNIQFEKVESQFRYSQEI